MNVLAVFFGRATPGFGSKAPASPYRKHEVYEKYLALYAVNQHTNTGLITNEGSGMLSHARDLKQGKLQLNIMVNQNYRNYTELQPPNSIL